MERKYIKYVETGIQNILNTGQKLTVVYIDNNGIQRSKQFIGN